MVTLLTVVHVAVCLFLIVIVLLQHGKGADAGATFGGSSQSLFGSEGPLPLLNKITTAVAIVFMMTSVALAYFSSSKSTGSVMTEVAKPAATGVQRVDDTTPAQGKNLPMPIPASENQKSASPVPESPAAQAAPGQGDTK
jgi:preprotein translocase subunit SecG